MFLINSKFKVGFLLVLFGITSCLSVTNDGQSSADLQKGNDLLESYKIKSTSKSRKVFNYLGSASLNGILYGLSNAFTGLGISYIIDGSIENYVLSSMLVGACIGIGLGIKIQYDSEKQKEVRILMQERIEELELLAKQNVEKI